MSLRRDRKCLKAINRHLFRFLALLAVIQKGERKKLLLLSLRPSVTRNDDHYKTFRDRS